MLMSMAETPDVSSELARLREQLEEETMKEERYAKENIRRRHNYLPLAFSLLTNLAKAGKLLDIRAAALNKSAKK